jgi:hypothetical protein
MMFLTDGSTSHIQSTKQNIKAFKSCVNGPPAALCQWFDKRQFPPFVNFDQESACSRFIFISLSLSNCFLTVPI